MLKVIISTVAATFLAAAGAALAQVDAPNCKGLDYEACKANSACAWVHSLMPGHTGTEDCRRGATMHPRARSSSTGPANAPKPREPVEEAKP
jgi:hypothetical protein